MEKLYELVYVEEDDRVPICKMVAEDPTVVSAFVSFLGKMGKRISVTEYGTKTYDIRNMFTDEEDSELEAIVFNYLDFREQIFEP